MSFNIRRLLLLTCIFFAVALLVVKVSNRIRWRRKKAELRKRVDKLMTPEEFSRLVAEFQAKLDELGSLLEKLQAK